MIYLCHGFALVSSYSFHASVRSSQWTTKFKSYLGRSARILQTILIFSGVGRANYCRKVESGVDSEPTLALAITLRINPASDALPRMLGLNLKLDDLPIHDLGKPNPLPDVL